MKTIKICESPPGKGCAIARELGGPCLECQLLQAKVTRALTQDANRELYLKLEGFDKSRQGAADAIRLEVEVEGWHKRIASLLRSCGREEKCRGATCERTIYFITTKAGKQAPYDLNGTTHFATCPDAKSFTKG